MPFKTYSIDELFWESNGKTVDGGVSMFDNGTELGESLAIHESIERDAFLSC